MVTGSCEVGIDGCCSGTTVEPEEPPNVTGKAAANTLPKKLFRYQEVVQ